MHRLAWTTLYRSLTRHKLFTALNIGGLALGIAVFLVLFLFVRFETGFDRVLPGSDDLWVVQRTLQFSGAQPVSIPSRRDQLALLQADNAGLVGTRLLSTEAAVRLGNGSVTETLGQVDPNYFALFPFAVDEGDPAAALKTPDGAVVTEHVARTYLPGGSAIGRTLSLVVNGKPRLVRVGAVLRDLPSGITHRNTIFVQLAPDADMFGQNTKGLVTFLRVPDPALAERLVAQMRSFNRRHPDPSFVGPPDLLKVTEMLVPLASLHLAELRDRAVVAALGLVGLLALLVAIANYVNLATARAASRAREVAVRKSLGATRAALIGQFLTEAVAMGVLATLLGLALAEIALPEVNALSGSDLALHYLGSGSILPVAATTALLVGLLAGFYPAMILSNYRPASILAGAGGSRTSRIGGRLRATLVVLQFAVAVALMIGTAVLVAQARHLQSADLGFDRDGLVMVPSFGDVALDAAQRSALAALASAPGVTSVAQSSAAAGGGSFSIATMHRPGASGADPSVIVNDVGQNFFSVYRARLLAGRWFDPARFGADDAARPGGTKSAYNLILNRTAVTRLGFASPQAAVGQTLAIAGAEKGTVIGVIDDIRFKGPRDPIEPQSYTLRLSGLSAPVLTARYAAANAPRPILDRFETIWRRIAPNVPFRALTVDQKLYEEYQRADDQRTRLFTAGAVLAVLIGCIGLYGLAAFDTERRIKEIGIRKALGASTRDVLALLVAKFLRPVLLANLIAWPLAWVAMQRWLSTFDDRIALSPHYFLLASALAVLIAVATVIGQSWRTARAEPARALRYE